ncbi:CD63 antigen-like [Anastrepha ludens]|uniref:CD63 antigen-like n=1 Tax=Anastrepha ludens TaxID=28586 RepID=UPI0023AF90C2|nr:CD63 antigen-like [Anastrepha ludens]
MGCCGFFIKWLLHFFNLLAVIVAVLLIILGSLILDALGGLKSVSNFENANIIPIIVIVLGGSIFIVSLLACCGAIKEINWCMIIYAILMFVLMGLQIALVVWVFLEKNEFLNTMDSIVLNAYDNRNNETDNSMNTLQITFNCCGYNNYTDYSSSGIPASCCGFSETDAPCPSSIYTTRQGCKTVFYNFWIDNLGFVRYGGIVVIVIEFLALISACGVAACRRKSFNTNTA